MHDAESVLALIDAALEGAGAVIPDPGMGPDAMRWTPDPEAATAARPVLFRQQFHGDLIGEEPLRRTGGAVAEYPGPSPAALNTMRCLQEGTGSLSLRMTDGPMEGEIIQVPNTGRPPAAYRFAEMPPVEAYLLGAGPWETIRRAVFHEYVFDSGIMSDGSLAYRYLGRV